MVLFTKTNQKQLIEFNADVLNKKLESNLIKFNEHKNEEGVRCLINLIEITRNLALLKMGYGCHNEDHYMQLKGRISAYTEIVNDLNNLVNKKEVTPQIKTEVRGQVKRPRTKSLAGAANW